MAPHSPNTGRAVPLVARSPPPSLALLSYRTAHSFWSSPFFTPLPPSALVHRPHAAYQPSRTTSAHPPINLIHCYFSGDSSPLYIPCMDFQAFIMASGCRGAGLPCGPTLPPAAGPGCDWGRTDGIMGPRAACTGFHRVGMAGWLRPRTGRSGSSSHGAVGRLEVRLASGRQTFGDRRVQDRRVEGRSM